MKFITKGAAIAATAATLLAAGCTCHGPGAQVTSATQPAGATAQQQAQGTPVKQAILMKDHGSCKGHSGTTAS